MEKSLDIFDIDKDFLYEALSSNSEDYIFVWNIKQDIALVSQSMVADFGFKDQYVEHFMNEWYSRINARDLDRIRKTVNEFIDSKQKQLCLEYQVRNIQDKYLWVSDRGLVKRDLVSNEPLILINVISNLEKEGRIDSITGLYTHEKCKEYFDKIALQPNGDYGSLLILGIDDFATINTLNNHSFGDMVLRVTVQEIQKMLPKSASIYRFDGDQFVILGHSMNKERMFEVYAAIKEYTHGKREINGQSYSFTVSGGIISYPEDGIIWADISKGAAVALKKAKETGKNRCIYYEKEMLAEKIQEQLIGRMLAESVENNFAGFKLVFQPVCKASDMTVVGAEALLRFVTKKGKVLPPDLFIPILENSNLIVPVGLWVLEEAIKVCKEWIKSIKDFVINVNVSYLQLREVDFCEKVANLLSKYDLDSKHITLELTESYFITDAKNINLSLAGLKELHLQMAMDDFGTGYSSLARLSKFNVDVIKIDKGFVKSLHSSKYNYDFIESVVRLCHNLGMKVCVEGVETCLEQKMVSLLNLDYIQGYYVSRPIDADVFYQTFISSKYDGSSLIIEPDAASLRNKLVSDKSFLLELMNASPLAMTIWSKSLDVMFCNKECLRLFGLDDEQELIKDYFKFSPEYQLDGRTSREKAKEIFSDSLLEGYGKFLWLHYNKKGEAIPSEVTITRITYQNEFILVSHIRDMREQLDNEDKLRKSSRKVKSLLDATPLCLNLWNRKMQNIMCNKMAVELFELKNEQEYIDRFFELSPEYQPDGILSSEKAAAKINEAFTHGRAQFQWMHCKLNGEEIPAEIILVKIEGLDDDGSDMVAGYTRDMREQLAIEEKLRKTNSRIKAIFDATPLCLNLWDKNMKNVMSNKEAANLFDLPNASDYVEKFFQLSPPFQPNGMPSPELAMQKIQQGFESGYEQFRWMHCKLNGEEIPVEITLVKIEGLDDDGGDLIAGYTRDIRPQLLAEKIERKANKRIRAMLDASPLACFVLNLNGDVIGCNQAAIKMFEVSGDVSSLSGLYPMYQPDGSLSDAKKAALMASVMQEKHISFEWMCMNKNKENIPCEVTLVRLKLDDEDIIVSYNRDLRELRKTLEANSRLKKIAYYDVLTGCSSRAAFMEKLQHIFTNAKRSDLVALLIFDLDHFKAVNDTYGHDIGDIVLKMVTDKFRTMIPEDAYIGRYGGDEFMVLLPNMPKEELEILLDCIVKEISELQIYSEKDMVRISISIGGSYLRASDANCEEFIKRADKALYEAKGKGRNCKVLD